MALVCWHPLELTAAMVNKILDPLQFQPYSYVFHIYCQIIWNGLFRGHGGKERLRIPVPMVKSLSQKYNGLDTFSVMCDLSL